MKNAFKQIVVAGLFLPAIVGTAVAQPAPASEPTPPADPVQPTTTAQPEPAVVTPTPTPTPTTEPAVEPAPAAAEAAKSPLNISMFMDGQYVLSTRKNDTTMAAHPGHRAFERNNGFALSFVGLDATYDAGAFGATTSLRYGSSVPTFYAAATNSPDLDGVAAVFQAYGTWKPNKEVTLDVGRFGTIYGAEVSESWKNLNYTRGGLYYAFQPFWHTGARVNYQASTELKLTAMVVNGVNNSTDTGKERPSVGLQGTYTSGAASVVLGYLGSTDPNTDFFNHFVDVIGTYSKDKISIVANADFFTSKAGGGDSKTYFGASLAGGYTVSESFRAALRGEALIYDKDDATGNVYTGTLTLDYRPLKNSNLVLRWDNRFEAGSNEIFFDRSNAATKSFAQSVLGFVVNSN